MWLTQLPVSEQSAAVVFNVQDPTLSVNVWDWTQSADVTSKSVPQGEILGFKVSTNMISALDATLRSPLSVSRAILRAQSW